MQAARQLEFLVGKQSTKYNTYDLGDALGIAQHHDAVSGTAKQHTTNDYAKRLAIGASEVRNKNFPNLIKFEKYISHVDICLFGQFSKSYDFLQAEAVVSSSLACLTRKQSGDKCSAPASAFAQVKFQMKRENTISPFFLSTYCSCPSLLPKNVEVSSVIVLCFQLQICL